MPANFSTRRIQTPNRTKPKNRRLLPDFRRSSTTERRRTAIRPLYHSCWKIVRSTRRDFLKLTRGQLETHINDETPISIGRIETVKEHVPAYPFIDNDAQPIIKAMLSDMTTEGRVKSNERMLKLLNEIELSRALQRCAKRAGINLGNKRLRFQASENSYATVYRRT